MSAIRERCSQPDVLAFAQEVRRFLHQHPKTRWMEEDSLSYIKQHILSIIAKTAAEKKVAVREAEGGLVVDITFDPKFDRILFRADVDALSIREKTGLDFESDTLGVMHACGHDMHSAMLLTAFKLIVEGSIQPQYNLRFVWQQAEENPGAEPIPESGGNVLVNRENVLDGIVRAYALHVQTKYDSGILLSRPGAMMGNSDRFEIEITGARGGHVAEPHRGINANDVAYAIQTALRSFLHNSLSGFEPSTLVHTGMQSGFGIDSSNIMPQEARLYYGIRTMLDANDKSKLYEALNKTIQLAAGQFPGIVAKLNMVYGHPATINNDDGHVNAVLRAAGLETDTCEPSLGGEDFSYYLLNRRGSMWYLGAGGDGFAPLHSPEFNPDEDVMPIGVAFWLLIAAN